MRILSYDPDEECKQAVIFARVSTDDQFKNGDSIPAQVTLLKDYCKNHNLKVIREPFEIPESSTNGERKELKNIRQLSYRIVLTAYKGHIKNIMNWIHSGQKGVSNYIFIKRD